MHVCTRIRLKPLIYYQISMLIILRAFGIRIRNKSKVEYCVRSHHVIICTNNFFFFEQIFGIYCVLSIIVLVFV